VLTLWNQANTQRYPAPHWSLRIKWLKALSSGGATLDPWLRSSKLVLFLSSFVANVFGLRKKLHITESDTKIGD